jgi:RNA-directed DNA polymerase
MVLNGLEEVLDKKFYSTKKGIIDKANTNKHKVNLIRYADDLVITANSEEIARGIKEILTGFLHERGLQLSEEKTHITHISKGFTFLGWEFRKFKGKFLIRPSKESIRSYTEKIHTILRTGRSWSQDAIIRAINPITRGWCNYHKHTAASKTFSKLDHVTFTMLYAWVRRRHPTESRRVAVDKYWHRKDSRKWVFATQTQELIGLSKTKIRRHCMVKLDKNPFLDRDYFEERRKRRAYW